MVTIKIEGMTFTRPLLDMSANVNILPKAIFYQFQLGALQPLFIELRLADGSVRGPHGIIEDVIVHVKNYYFSVDCIVTDMKVTRELR